jgi:tetratricopeptide (TPR) repeat protein
MQRLPHIVLAGLVLVASVKVQAQGGGVDLKAIEQLKQASEQTSYPKRAVRTRVKVSNPKLRDAVNAYRADKIAEAQRLLDELLVDGTLSEGDRGITEFFMGKVLFRQNLFYSSVPYFQSVVRSQSGTAFYPYSFQRLVWIAKRDGLYDLLVDPLRNRKSGLIPRHYRNDVYYIFARTYFEEASYSKAKQAIRGIQPSSEYYHEGLLMLALMQFKEGNVEEALTSFGEASKSPDEDVKGLAQLGIARIHYERNNDKLALQNYSLVADTSRHWLEAQLEAAWSHFRSNEPSLALGNVHPFDSEPFSGVFSPEASIIKSTVFFRLCKYGDAEKAILTFFEKYMPVYRQLEAFNVKYARNEAGYKQEILKAVFRVQTELPAPLMHEIFSQTWFRSRVDR